MSSTMFEIPSTPEREVAISVTDVSKSYRVPSHRVDTLKERFSHPLKAAESRELQALKDISFEVERGEFFGVVGRNGSGKSSLLKLLGSIYRADSGTIRIAGRVAPFIELGVGFNQELSALDNVLLNGVMMGLTPREARHRFDAVLEFAELEEFAELKLKNYSSGMLVRLGFSLMTQVDADVFLVDEVLAVGDAAFQQKCFDAFGRLHQQGRTIVLVTHDMVAVQSHCDRAILLESGVLEESGKPVDIARSYLEVSFAQRRHSADPEDVSFAGEEDVVEFHGVRVVGDDGEATANLAAGEAIRLEADIGSRGTVERPVFAYSIVNADGQPIFSTRPIRLEQEALHPGERALVSSVIDNPLTPGHYFVHVGVGREAGNDTETIAFRKNATDFVVYGPERFVGFVNLDYEATARVKEEG
jgi:ABC-type polysaccharide/polyol phosphate transport system ATPase subunit